MTIDKNFQTPEWVAEYMVSMIPAGAKTILEPTPGMRTIVNVLEKNNYIVVTPIDYFLLEKQQFDGIVMNPPFSSKSADVTNAPKDTDISGMKIGYFILTDCMKMSNSIIALMPWFTISDSDVRMRMIRDFGLKSVTPLPRKTFQYARIQTVILELEKGYQGETEFKTHLI